VTFWYGSGSSDPYLWLTDTAPDPVLFVSGLQDASKKLFCFLSFFAYYFLKIHLHHSSQIKSQKSIFKTVKNQGFSYNFCLMMGGSGAESESVGTSDKRIRVREAQKHQNQEHWQEPVSNM
jgi:hypothetical protein